MKTLLPGFEIKKNEAGKPKVLAAVRRTWGEEKRKEIEPFKFKYRGPRAAGWEWKGRGLQRNRKPTSGKACSGCGLTSKEEIGRGETKLEAWLKPERLKPEKRQA